RQLAESSEQVRAMRHDMRHQLAALRGYLEVSDSAGALDYLDKIGDAERAVAGLGQDASVFGRLEPTDNFAVNAVVSYYLGAAEAQGIAIDLRLDVPADLGRVSESDISVVFGNLLENAIEASLYLPAEQRSIRVRCRVSSDRLTLTVDNSFDGFVNARGGVFYSRKRTGKGIGLSSVRSIVERYDGSMKVEAANGQFMVSLTMRL
ncbi:MAG: ATP-binding protein, partial [Coriobacteriia bacterium]|nr:ATP-binding protein [Coriobacteriia bacterium]